MVEAWILVIFCGLICLAAGIDKFYNRRNRLTLDLLTSFTPLRKQVKMNTIEYLQIFDIVKQQFERSFRDSTLPPNMIDIMAHTRAVNEAMKLHRHKQIVSYYKKMKAGTL